MRPRAGASSASRQATAVDLPAPDGPTRAVTAPGSIVAVNEAGAQTPRASTLTPSKRIGCAPAGGAARVPRGRGGSASMTAKAASAAATPFAEAWNCAPTWRRGSKTSGASMMTASPLNRSMPP